MKQHQIRKKFYTKFNGNPNFLTPDIEKYSQVEDWIYEISSGTGFDKEPIFGVTIIHKDTLETSDKSTGVFRSLQEAEDYAQTVLT